MLTNPLYLEVIMAQSRDVIPRSLWQLPSSMFSNFPGWEDMGERMTQWIGANRGVTLSEDNQRIYIQADLPGLKREDINVSLHKNTLVIQGEKKEEETDENKRFYRRAQRSFYYEVELPNNVEENPEQADYENGVLNITFQKTSEGNVKKISIGGTGTQQQRQQMTQQKQTQTQQTQQKQQTQTTQKQSQQKKNFSGNGR